jgi:YidC/Oxa1 family membrane protein insertase
MNILIAPFVNALFGFYYLFGNLGWSVVIVTVLIRIVLLPLVIPSLKSAKKISELQPKLKKLQEKYKGEKEKLAKAQMDMYKEEGVNPLSGCLPQLLQVAVLIIFFSAFNMVTNYTIGKGSVEEINKHLISETPAKVFGDGLSIYWLLPFILLVGSGVLQYFSSKLMMPAPKVDASIIKATKDKEDDMMSMMRTQSTYMMPIMTIFIGWSFSLGMLLYWFVNSLVMLGQQIAVEKMNKK